MLRIMLAALAVAAVAGVLAMLLSTGAVLIQVLGTAVMTAVAAALMMSCSLLTDREKARTAGLVGMAGVVIEFILGLVAVWGEGLVPDGVYTSLIIIPCITPPAMFYLRMAAIPKGRVAGWTGVGVCAVVLALVSIPSWTSPDWSGYSNWLGTSFAIGGFGVLASASLAGAGYDRRYWRYVGVLAAIVGAIAGTVGIWRDIHSGDIPFSIITCVAILLAHANLVVLCPLKPNRRWLAWGTIAAAILCGVLLEIVLISNGISGFTSDSGPDSLLARGGGALGIVAACGSLALLVLVVLNRRSEHKPILAVFEQFTLICPGCNRQQVFKAGESQCPTCLLHIKATFREPRCPSAAT